MGRKRKYLTEEERVQAQREWNRKYYTKNKEKLNMKQMEKYYEGKLKEIRQKLSELQ
jgi:hypothetical protein